jgi:hypothetical protein
LTPEGRQSLESILSDVLARELAQVKAKAEPFLKRGLENPYRSERAWARERLRIEESMEQGRGRLQYNIQALQLASDKVPVYFVRAEWLIDKRQGFAATVWVRGDRQLEVLETNVSPASMMRMSLFSGGVHPTHMGLILNVLDRDSDGWGEVLFSSEGYESRTISLQEYSPSGFEKPAIQMSGGC